jgi:hypothetical protein
VSDGESLQTAILEWQKKYGIADGDPAMAVVELLTIHLTAVKPSALPVEGEREVPPSYAEFRETVELLDRRAKCFVDQSLDLIQQLRSSPDIDEEMSRFQMKSIILIAAVMLLFGVCIGHFLP